MSSIDPLKTDLHIDSVPSPIVHNDEDITERESKAGGSKNLSSEPSAKILKLLTSMAKEYPSICGA